MTSACEAREMRPDECWSTAACRCVVCCGPRNLACVFFGPQGGLRAKICHTHTWPKNDTLRTNSFTPWLNCYNCLSKLNTHQGTWQCEDKRKAARSSTTVRVTPYLACTRTRVLTDEEIKKRHDSVQIGLVRMPKWMRF